jgi:hypothetical protein
VMLNCCEKFENLGSLFKGAGLGEDRREVQTPPKPEIPD